MLERHGSGRRQPSSVAWAVYDAYAEAWLSKEPLFGALLASSPLKRLRNVRFLGAIDLFSRLGQLRQPSHQSRYAHSVGVAYLTARACSALLVQPDVARLLVAAALLHDVGHGALSHSTEPYFGSRFSISHKHVGTRVIQGDLFLGLEVCEILGDYGIDPSQLNTMLTRNGVLDGAPPLFALPINVDTLDGIVRSGEFFEPDSCAPLPDYYLDVLVNPSAATASLADRFWQLKDRIYRHYIHNGRWSIYDHMLSVALYDADPLVRATDFFLTDDEFCDAFSSQLARVQNRRYDLEFAIANRNIEVPRQFCINQNKTLNGWGTIAKRYFVRRM